MVDRIAGTHDDDRLIAHLSADEPPENAAIVCGLYLRQDRQGCCRRLMAEDVRIDPAAADLEPENDASDGPDGGLSIDSAGDLYRLQSAPDGSSLPQLRRHCQRRGTRPCGELVTLRHLTGWLQRYEPAVRLTKAVVSAHERHEGVSVTVLRAELRRLQESPIVLNRGLREAVLGAIAREGMSMSEIAIRCGRRKRDQRGCESGETSWLARRIGILPEGGQPEPTPWVHSDVLALIARDGLGVAPREVEVPIGQGPASCVL